MVSHALVITKYVLLSFGYSVTCGLTCVKDTSIYVNVRLLRFLAQIYSWLVSCTRNGALYRFTHSKLHSTKPYLICNPTQEKICERCNGTTTTANFG